MPDLDPRIILAQRQLPTLADMQDEQQKRQIQEQEVELRRQEILARRDAIIEAAQRRNQVAQPKPLTPKDEMEAQDLRVKQAVMVGNLLEGATDDDSYEQAKQGIAQIVGPDYVQHLPQTFDPAANARLVAQGKALVAKTAAATGLVRTEIPDPTDPTKTVQTWIRPTENLQLPVPSKAATAKAANLGSFEDYVTRTYGENPASSDILKARKEYNQADDKATSFAANDVTQVTPAAVDLAALNYRKTGVMPPLGMGDKSTRQKILNRAASLTPTDIAKIEAGGTDIAGNKADYKANADTLTQLTKQRGAIGAFEQTAQKNIDVFLKQAEKVTDTGIPLLNTPARWVSGAGGSEDQAAYQAARLVAINEIAKITSNPTLSGTLSDSARHEVEAFNPQNATLGQTRAVMKLLKQDMQNRTNALDKEIEDVRKRIGGGQTGSAAPAAAPAAVGGLTYADYLKSKGKK